MLFALMFIEQAFLFRRVLFRVIHVAGTVVKREILFLSVTVSHLIYRCDTTFIPYLGKYQT